MGAEPKTIPGPRNWSGCPQQNRVVNFRESLENVSSVVVLVRRLIVMSIMASGVRKRVGSSYLGELCKSVMKQFSSVCVFDGGRDYECNNIKPPMERLPQGSGRAGRSGRSESILQDRRQTA